MTDETNGRTITNRDLWLRLEDVSKAMNNQGALVAGVASQVAALVEMSRDLKGFSASLAARQDNSERDLLQMGNRLGNLERAHERPPLSAEDITEIKRMLTLVRSRGVVDIFTPDEVSQVRDHLKNRGEENEAKKAVLLRMAEMDHWRDRLEQAARERDSKITLLDQRQIDFGQRVEAHRAQLNEHGNRLTQREMTHHLTDEELAQTRNVLTDYARSRKEARRRWSTVRTNLLSGIITTACLSPIAVTITLLISRAVH